LNSPFFIAKRILTSGETSRELSKPIVKIATIGISLGIMVMILSISVVNGFQTEIREKVVGFGAHLSITNFGTSDGLASKLLVNQPFYSELRKVDGVKSISIFALKEGVIETPENIQGVLTKGVGEDYDWSFLESKLVEGRLLRIDEENPSQELLMSKFLAGRMQLKIGDKVPIYFQNARGSMSQRNFEIVGLFETGLIEMDEEFVFVDIGQIRKINQWGIEAFLQYSGCQNDSMIFTAIGRGGDGDHRYSWSLPGLNGPGPHKICSKDIDSLFVAVTDRSETQPDTAYATLSSGMSNVCTCLDESQVILTTSGGSGKLYTGGFEVQLNKFEDLAEMDRIIYEYINYDLQTTTIQQHLPEVFNWLEMLDLNTIIIISLMILISIINMTSALLILIMERTVMIGTLKALGASGWFIQKIFLIKAAYMILSGLIIGNILGVGLALIQKEFGVIRLDPENYYVSEVPILLDLSSVIALNILTLGVCLIALLIPSLTVSQIRPSKAIRFN
jgi:lipoprotein-releasing system permease protein